MCTLPYPRDPGRCVVAIVDEVTHRGFDRVNVAHPVVVGRHPADAALELDQLGQGAECVLLAHHGGDVTRVSESIPAVRSKVTFVGGVLSGVGMPVSFVGLPFAQVG
jgi:hypothetical protein